MRGTLLLRCPAIGVRSKTLGTGHLGLHSRRSLQPGLSHGEPSARRLRPGSQFSFRGRVRDVGKSTNSASEASGRPSTLNQQRHARLHQLDDHHRQAIDEAEQRRRHCCIGQAGQIQPPVRTADETGNRCNPSHPAPTTPSSPPADSTPIRWQSVPRDPDYSGRAGRKR